MPTKPKTPRKKKAVAAPSEAAAPATLTGPPAYSFNILDTDADIMDVSMQLLHSLSEKEKNKPAGFRTMAQVRQHMVPFRNFYYQNGWGSYGLPQSGVMDIIGGENIGKSTLAMTQVGWAMMAGCPALVLESEAKALAPERVLRCLSTDPAQAVKMLRHIWWDKIRTLEEMDDKITKWVGVMRGKLVGDNKLSVCVAKDTPLVVVVDSWSKLMSPDEAKGFYDYGKNMDPEEKKKFKATGTASNLGHSKFAAHWCRRLPAFLDDNNVVLILIHHQTDKIDMSGGVTSFMSAETSALYNKNHVGGRSINQNAAMQVILARKSLAKDAQNNPTGTIIRARIDKNSFGPVNRTMEWELRNEHKRDTSTYLEPAIIFDNAMATWMADNRLLGVTVNLRRYSCERLGLVGASAEELCALFHANRDLMDELGRQRGIVGYNNVIDTIDAHQKKVAEEAAAAGEANASQPEENPDEASPGA